MILLFSGSIESRMGECARYNTMCLFQLRNKLVPREMTLV